jgi:hypothetical protein
VYCAGVIFGDFWCTPECKCKCKKKIHYTAMPGCYIRYIEGV